ncbi:outer membrane protein [Dongia sp.]|uniref:outer membrane protein n=1 Tax=Dongia sp. TaxID=1977262 RepID=UPI0035B22A8A
MGTLRYAVITAFCCNGLAIAQASAQSAPAVDWSGFSVSALAGGGILTPETDAEGLDPSAYFSAASDLKQLKDAGSGSPTEWDWSASLQVGYSRQFGNIVLGVGATGDLLLWDEKRSSTQDWISLAGTEFTLKQRVEADWMVALRPRLGWAQDNWLVYVMAGPTLSRLKIETDYSDNVGTGAEGHSSDSETKLGYVIGIGGDYAIDKNWSVSAQYSYTDLGTVDTRTHVFNASQAANPGDIDSSVDLSSHMAMIGFTYRFDAF